MLPWMQGYHLTFARVSCKDTFYQCVFLLCDTAAPVMQAGSQAKAHFDMTLEEYMPHLSLLYSDIDKRARYVPTLQAAWPHVCTIWARLQMQACMQTICDIARAPCSLGLA